MDKTIYEQFLASATLHSKDLACRFEHRTWNYKQLNRLINKTAGKLLNLGVKENEPVAICMPNCPEALCLFYALSQIGAIAYFIHPLTPPLRLANFINKSGARLVFALSDRALSYKQALPDEIKVIAVNPFFHTNPIKAIYLRKISHFDSKVIKHWHLHGKRTSQFAKKKGQDDAVYLNTGGTNGEPKIIELSNNAINNLAMKGYPLIGGDVKDIKMLTAIPLFHGFGLVMGVHTPLSNGASTVLMLKFQTKEAISLIRKGQATTIIGVPALYNALLSKDSFYGPWLKKQIIAFIGGDSVPPSLLDRWNENMIKYGSKARLYEGYGLTETVNVSNVNTNANHKKGSVGKALPGLDEKIVDLTTRKVLPPNSLGEILIAGDTLMTGYLNDPKLTEETFVTIDGKRYMQTKDYGSLDEDGYLTYKQRLRRIVKVNGEGLCPSDVEKVALSFYEIYEAYCFGVPNAKTGSNLRLAIVIRHGYQEPSEDELKSQLNASIKERLTTNYLPDKIIVLPKLPRTPVGKIDDAAISKMEEQGNL
jgi:long-chain acyl-CoA synthetase